MRTTLNVALMLLTQLPLAIGHAEAATVLPDEARQFNHILAFPPGDFKEVVQPNFDTPYSSACSI